ncbi:Bifunctional inhibitor/plant lipid transfer protein/seed storage helical domain containing protein [Parasponia andersonii]|uniref:Bifunctional inhibitor/plant lipid transfer protein/seed storage helical domain containing protein n=1 Tax=Parasponia andersonii TaxID=3476 RepID=A0A2P5E3E0_PARAD|nr:Bifunctional inhibitor/plant lipid transfer protein/seed storage helical domain containing protein [Parasponia andersonii]
MALPAYSSMIITPVVISTLLCFTMAQPPAPVQSPPSQPEPVCVGELVLFSPCLSFVSSPPNNLSATAPSRCCDAFLSSVNSGDAFCLCYLLRQPRILGFPLNESRILALPVVCSPGNHESAGSGNLEALCSGSEALPPLQNVTVPGVSNTSASGSNNQSSPLTSLPPKFDNASAPSSLPLDSKNPRRKSSPPPELAKAPQAPPSSSAELPRSAVGDRSYSTTSWFQKGLLVVLLVSTCL